MNNNNSAKETSVFVPYAAIPPRVIVWSAMAGLGIALPLIFLFSLLVAAPSEAQAAAVSARKAAVLATNPGWLALKALLLVPVMEEVFYRGLIMQFLRRYLPVWAAVLIPTLMFAFTHLDGQNNIVRVGFAFVAGLCFSWLVLKTGSLWSSIICHSAINLMVNFVLNPLFIARGIAGPQGWTSPLALVFLAGSLLVLATAVRTLRMEFGRRVSVCVAS